MSTFGEPRKTAVSLASYGVLIRRPLMLGAVALIVVNLLDLLLPLVLGKAIDALVAGSGSRGLIVFAVAYTAMAAVQAGCRFAWRVSLNRGGISVAHDVRDRVGQSAIDSFRPDAASGRVVALVSSDAESVGRLYDSGVVIVIDALFGIIGVPIVLMCLDAHLALLTLVPLPLISVGAFAFDRFIKSQYSAGQEQLAKMSALVEEALGRIRAVKVNTAECAFVSRFTKLSSEYLIAAYRLNATESMFGPFMASALTISLVTLLAVGGQQVVAGTLTVGAFVAFQRSLERLLWPMNAVALALTTYKKSVVSAGRVSDFLKDWEPVPQGTAELGPAEPLLQLSEVSVSLRDSSAIVKDVSLVISMGEKVALVGPTGSGKSTLAFAICGLLPETTRQGSIMLRGVDVTKLPRATVTSLIAVVPQEVFLFGITVRENLLLGLPNGASEPSDSELYAVLETAGIRGDVERLPKALDTVLGERGLSLSGGQRQRLTLARAILRRPALLVLDNALSAVDAETEARIVERLHSLGCAILCITHRLSTAQEMQRVVVLEGGRKTQDGPRDVVAAESHGWFKSFCDHQRAEAELGRYA